MKKIFWGVVCVVVGLTGFLVLRGMQISLVLALLGCFFIIWGGFERFAHLGHTGPKSSPTEPREASSLSRLNESEAEVWVARELGRLRVPDDLIAPVCEMTGLNWDEAKRLIRSVQDCDTVAIRSGRRRMALTLGCPIIAIGICLLVGTTFSLMNNIAVTHSAGTAQPQVYYWFFAGLLMTGGGLYSMSRTNS
jgi:hypothetical protein